MTRLGAQKWFFFIDRQPYATTVDDRDWIMTAFAQRFIYENPPHRISSSTKEVASAIPVRDLVHFHQPDIGA